MTYIPQGKVYIPPEWTGKQALTIWEFIEEIATTIWEVHEKAILEAANIENSMLEPPEHEDDGMYTDEDYIPF